MFVKRLFEHVIISFQILNIIICLNLVIMYHDLRNLCQDNGIMFNCFFDPFIPTVK